MVETSIAYEDDVVVERKARELKVKQEAYTLEFVENLHAGLTNQLLEDPKQLEKLYQKLCRDLSRKHKYMMNKAEINKIYQELLKTGRVAPSFIVDSVTKNKSVRSRSGVLPISLATDGNNFSCAFDCHFCPNEIVANGAPRDIARSYLSSEGTFIRGAVEKFEAAGQIWRRLLELEFMGHPPDKLEIIVLGGTWDSYEAEYREHFITQIFYAANVFHRFSMRMNGDLTPLTHEWAKLSPFQKGLGFDVENNIKSKLRPPKSLDEEKAENQNAPCARIIGILLETRPDQISKPSLIKLRWLGCTRIQLGLQHTDNAILKLNNRGHGVEKSVSAIKFARDAGFKVDGHLMPDLPGTTAEKDYEMFSRVFGGEDLQLDYCKLYPCLDLPYTKTREWKESGEWKPMAEFNFPVFMEIIRHAMATVPPWVRVNRVQRDFPEATEKNKFLGFVSDNIKSNLQQMVVSELEKHGQGCYDVRSREIKNQFPSDCDKRARLFCRCYRANEGTEFFFSVELPEKKAKCADDAMLMGLLRLRLPDVDVQRVQGLAARVPSHFLPEFAARPIARIRELHVYGNLRMVNPQTAGKDTDRLSQHTGVGKYLLAVAECVALQCGFKEMAIISGVGVRSYYARHGYHYNAEGPGEYMMKDLTGAGALLPLGIFGHIHDPEALLAPLRGLGIVQKYLPPLQLSRPKGGSCDDSGAAGWSAVHSYAHIQEGRAQLVVVDMVEGTANLKEQRSKVWTATQVLVVCGTAVTVVTVAAVAAKSEGVKEWLRSSKDWVRSLCGAATS